MIAFGPIPSRRLGQSLGINHIPPKSCSYDCVYCQVGPTLSTDLQRRPFYEPEAVVAAVRQKVQAVQAQGGRIDYLSFVPDGEPTLDINLGRMIDMLRPLNLKMAVITNGSLLWHAGVRAELAKADCVSLKVDAVSDDVWRRINRPAQSLSLNDILAGALAFAGDFKGELITETMLIEGINDAAPELRRTAQFLGKLRPARAYLAIPTRPPQESRAKAPGEEKLTEAWQIFSEYLPGKVEILTGYSAEPFTATGDVVQNLLDITCVHPMRESEVQALLRQAGVDPAVLQTLIAEDKIVRVLHEGQAFFVRKLPRTKSE
ncbi:MAG: radical SAM protein [Thermoanaerobaculia bacterium]|nr:radical SAM protein [Thermoanaerobaculia bacterium]